MGSNVAECGSWMGLQVNLIQTRPILERQRQLVPEGWQRQSPDPGLAGCICLSLQDGSLLSIALLRTHAHAQHAQMGFFPSFTPMFSSISASSRNYFH